MSRFSTSLLFKSGLLLATVLVTSSSRLHAETTLPQNLNLRPQTATTKPQLNVADSSHRQATTQPKLTTGSSSTDSNPATASKVVTIKNSILKHQQPSTTPAVKPAATATNAQPPVVNAINLVLKLNEKKVYVYKGDKVIAKYPVAIGKKGWETPTGEWQIMEKIKNPAWTSFKTGEVVAAGRENPLGERWIGFWTDGQDVIGFHGTPDIQSIGTAASHGCVRMLNRDVKALFPLVQVGTTVNVVDN
jgi:lipoprotein-anchoring transpeptidase ErfK/SrfK